MTCYQSSTSINFKSALAPSLIKQVYENTNKQPPKIINVMFFKLASDLSDITAPQIGKKTLHADKASTKDYSIA